MLEEHVAQEHMLLCRTHIHPSFDPPLTKHASTPPSSESLLAYILLCHHEKRPNSRHINL